MREQETCLLPENLAVLEPPSATDNLKTFISLIGFSQFNNPDLDQPSKQPELTLSQQEIKPIEIGAVTMVNRAKPKGKEGKSLISERRSIIPSLCFT